MAHDCTLKSTCPLAKSLSVIMCIFIPVITGWVSWTNVRLDKAEANTEILIRVVEKVDNTEKKVDRINTKVDKVFDYLLDKKP